MKPYKCCRRDVGNEGDLGGKRNNRRQERVRSVASDPDNLENSKGTEREAQDSQSLIK